MLTEKLAQDIALATEAKLTQKTAAFAGTMARGLSDGASDAVGGGASRILKGLGVGAGAAGLGAAAAHYAPEVGTMAGEAVGNYETTMPDEALMQNRLLNREIKNQEAATQADDIRALGNRLYGDASAGMQGMGDSLNSLSGIAGDAIGNTFSAAGELGGDIGRGIDGVSNQMDSHMGTLANMAGSMGRGQEVLNDEFIANQIAQAGSLGQGANMDLINAAGTSAGNMYDAALRDANQIGNEVMPTAAGGFGDALTNAPEQVKQYLAMQAARARQGLDRLPGQLQALPGQVQNAFNSLSTPRAAQQPAYQRPLPNDR